MKKKKRLETLATSRQIKEKRLPSFAQQKKRGKNYQNNNKSNLKKKKGAVQCERISLHSGLLKQPSGCESVPREMKEKRKKSHGRRWSLRHKKKKKA